VKRTVDGSLFLLPIRFSAYMKNLLPLACISQTKVDEPRKEMATSWTIVVQFQADLRTVSSQSLDGFWDPLSLEPMTTGSKAVRAW
jgi:hypothetical protein